ncbi:hypothetical protein R3P38DRAFT_3114250 [Favolaschia claudopus]|uniref:Uncharacterized protein n=1 Tax=Favolaschia claudopus TaxID=2862362 RepID=A0AAV9ZHD9_9AGAR
MTSYLDDDYLPSSPTSLALDYEQSQHKQPIRDEYEAEMSPQDLAEYREWCRRKRVKRGYENAQDDDYPLCQRRRLEGYQEIKPEPVSSPVRTPRPSAVASNEKTRRDFEPGGFLNSQTTSQDAIDHLVGQQEPSQQPLSSGFDYGITSQDVLSQLDHRQQRVVYDGEPSPEPETYEQLRTRCVRLEAERDEALRELHAARSACTEAQEAQIRAEKRLVEWEEAVVGAAPLVKLMIPCIY